MWLGVAGLGGTPLLLSLPVRAGSWPLGGGSFWLQGQWGVGLLPAPAKLLMAFSVASLTG